MAEILSEKKAVKLLRPNSFGLITGTFDLVHLGHLRFIKQARKILGKKKKLLIIILDDRQVTIRKGPDKPLFNAKYRLEFLSYIKGVDYVLLWKEKWQGLRKFIRVIKPLNYFVSDKDQGLQNKKEIIEAYGGVLTVLGKQGSYSSTGIIRNIIKKFSNGSK